MTKEEPIKLTQAQARWVIAQIRKGAGMSNKELKKAIPQLFPYERLKTL